MATRRPPPSADWLSGREMREMADDFERFKTIIDDGVGRGLCSVALNWVNEPLLRTTSGS